MVDLDKQIVPVLEDANMLVIKTAPQAAAAMEALKSIDGLIAEVHKSQDPIVAAANNTHKIAVAERNRLLTPLLSAKGIVTDKVAGFNKEQKSLADLEDQRRADEIRKERDALAKKAQAKIEALADKSLDISAEIAEIETILRNPELSDEESRVYQNKINVLLTRQNQTIGTIEAKQAEIEAVISAPIPQAATAPRVSAPGLVTKAVKVGVVVNLMKLVKSVAAGSVPIGVLTFDQGTINKLANAGMIMPGVDITTRESNYTRSSKRAA